MVAIDGFDALMVEIGKALYGNAIIPSETEKQLEGKNKRRIQQYNKQWDALNKRPEMRESLQELNKAERIEEEKREEKAELTTWDHFRRGIRATAEKQFEVAIEEYQKAIEKDPENVAAYNNLGIIYGDLKRQEEAIELYLKALELDPDYANAYNNLGVIYEDQGLLEKALENYTKAIELEPDFAYAYNNRGEIYVKMGQPEKAIKEYTRAIELDPKDKDMYLNRANAYRTMGKGGLAEEDERTARKL